MKSGHYSRPRLGYTDIGNHHSNHSVPGTIYKCTVRFVRWLDILKTAFTRIGTLLACNICMVIT